MSIKIKRIYDEPAKDDGLRLLVDRLWPRGVSKERAALDDWIKEIAPTSELRVWFDHDPKKFQEFTAKYNVELAANPAVAQLRAKMKDHKNVTLLYAAKDPSVNHAAVLKNFLTK